MRTTAGNKETPFPARFWFHGVCGMVGELQAEGLSEKTKTLSVPIKAHAWIA